MLFWLTDLPEKHSGIRTKPAVAQYKHYIYHFHPVFMKIYASALLALALTAQLAAQPEAPPVPAKPMSAQLVELYDMGNLLTALNKPEDAYLYYCYVVRAFKTKEMHNNAGVSAVLGALRYFRPNEPEVKYRYPLELDLNSVSGKGDSDFKTLRSKMLRQAIAHFDSTLLLDPRYAPAYLNKACALALLGENHNAQSAAADAQRAASTPKVAADVQVLLGILYALQGDTTKAKTVFKTAAEKGSSLGAYNLNVLTGQPQLIVSSNPVLGGSEEMIDNLSLLDPYNIPEVDPKSEVALGPQLKFYHNLHPGSNALFYFSDNTATGQQTYFLLTKPNYTGQTGKKLKIGASRAEILTAYGQPKKALETSTGQIVLYPAMILMLGPDGKLVQWALYGENG